jgi:hypothetical protein
MREISGAAVDSHSIVKRDYVPRKLIDRKLIPTIRRKLRLSHSSICHVDLGPHPLHSRQHPLIPLMISVDSPEILCDDSLPWRQEC